MNLTDDEVLRFMKGGPVLFGDVCAVYSVTLGEIIDIGYSKFQQYLSLLTAQKPVPSRRDDKQYAQMMSQITDFQFIILMATSDQQVNTTLRDAFQFFTHSDILLSIAPAQIVFEPLEEKHILNEENFYDFQTLLRRMYFLEQDGDAIVISADDPPETRRLKEQMRANRQKVRRAKAKEAARKQGSELQFSDLIGSLTINHCGLNMANIWGVSYYALQDQLKRMGQRDTYDINNRAMLAGAKINKSQLKYWMRSIADSSKS